MLRVMDCGDVSGENKTPYNIRSPLVVHIIRGRFELTVYYLLVSTNVLRTQRNCQSRQDNRPLGQKQRIRYSCETQKCYLISFTVHLCFGTYFATIYESVVNCKGLANPIEGQNHPYTTVFLFHGLSLENVKRVPIPSSSRCHLIQRTGQIK